MNRPSVSMLCRAIAALFIVAALGACESGDPAALIASAKAYMAKSDYKSATIQLKSALQKAPDNAESRFLLAKSLLATGDAAGAQAEARKALELKYPADEAYPLLARALLAEGEYQKVVSELGQLRLGSAQARADLGASVAVAYLTLGDGKNGQAALDAVLAESPADARALTVAAQLAIAQKDFAKANKQIDAALAAAPKDAEAMTLKASLLAGEGKTEDARKLLERAVEVAPRAVGAQFALLSLLVSSGQVDKAAAQLDAMKKIAPRDIRTLYVDALIAYSQGDAKRAHESIQKVLSVRPQHLPSLYLSGLADLKLGSVAAAEEALRKVAAQAPNDPNVQRALAATYLRLGQPAKALDILDAALRRSPRDASLLRVAGEAYLASGDIAKAGQYYERANEIDKGNVPSEVRLAQVRFAAGETAQAFKDLEDLSRAEPSQYQADLALISAHLRRGEFDSALTAVNALEKKQPNNPLTYSIKGMIYAAKRDFKSARVSFEKALQIRPGYFTALRGVALLDLQEKKPEQARKRYEEALAKDPKNEQLLLGYAELLSLSGQPPDAVKAALGRAIDAQPGSVPARLALINYSARRGDVKGALAAAQAAQAAMPNNPQIVESLGNAQLAAGDTNQALEVFLRLAQMQPQQAAPLLKVAQAQIAVKDYAAATATLRKALALRPDLPEAWIGLANTYLLSGRPDEAIAEARKLQKDKPNRALGYALEGEVLEAQKKFPEAATKYREALEREPSPTVAMHRYGVLEKAGDSAEANRMAERWFQEHPKDLTLRLFIAVQSQLKKDYPKAIAQYRAALEIEPDNGVILNNLAIVLAESGDPKASEYAERAYSLLPYNADVMDTLGWMLVQNRETTRGTELLRAASSVAPSNYTIRLHFAKALIQSGDKAGARRELENLIQLDRPAPIRDDAQKLLSGL